MANARSRTRVARLLVAVLWAIGLGVVVAPTPAQAGDTCVVQYFCWYYSTNQNGYRGKMYTYTSGWTRMSSLVDNSESSWEKQTSDSSCVTQGRPWVFMRDTGTPYGNVSYLVAISYNQHHNTFANLVSYWNLNDRFNDIWNSCR